MPNKAKKSFQEATKTGNFKYGSRFNVLNDEEEKGNTPNDLTTHFHVAFELRMSAKFIAKGSTNSGAKNKTSGTLTLSGRVSYEWVS